MPKLVEICRVDHEIPTPRCTKARTQGAGLGVRAGLASCDSIRIMFHLALPVNTSLTPQALSRAGRSRQISARVGRQTKGHPDSASRFWPRKLAGKKEIHYIDRANWTTVRQSLIEIAFRQRGYNLHQLLEVCPVNAQEGVKADEGYTPCEDLGVSIQGQDANHAWQAAAALAKALRIPVRVWFQWRTRPDAKFPGKRSLLAIDPLRS